MTSTQHADLMSPAPLVAAAGGAEERHSCSSGWIRLVVICGIVLAALVTLLGLDHAGVAARHQETPHRAAGAGSAVHLVRTNAELYRLWDQKQLRGRTVVHLGRFLHYIPVGTGSGSGYTVPRSRYPLRVNPPHHFVPAEVDYRNILWVALNSGIARRTFNVIPVADFRERFELPASAGIPADVAEHDCALPRTITARLPRLSEPVVLNIDASYFAHTDPVQLAAQLRESGLAADLVTLCLSEDSPDVSAGERAAALQAARELGGLIQTGSGL